MARTFVVARNPDPDSRLPYLIRLPVGITGLILKTKDTWPRTAAVYCHRADAWSLGAEIIEQVGVRSCERRGRAIDLVLARRRENRSQIVFTTKAGREVIFGQTARTAKRAPRGARAGAARERLSRARHPGHARARSGRGRRPVLVAPQTRACREWMAGGLLARVQVRYPAVPVMFLETRPLAEEWTYRFLGAALAEAEGEARYLDVAEAPSPYAWE